MLGLNRCYLIGTLGADPSPGLSSAGLPAVVLDLVTPGGARVGSTWVDRPDHHRVTCIGSVLRLLADAHAGDVIGVEATLHCAAPGSPPELRAVALLFHRPLPRPGDPRG